jgi:hypothetical protein
MFKITRKSRLVKVAAATAAVGSIAAIGFGGNSPANADPKQYEALVAIGSDTTQDVLNAFAGFSSGINYTPLQSSVATNQTQIISFNAGATSCIATKTGAGLILRPNGSTGGRRALSQIGQGTTTWGTGSPCGAKDVSGLIDFARSSSGPASGDLGTDLTYVPFARDALTFAYYSADGTSGTDTTRANLTSIYTNGTGLIGTTPVIPCGIQTSSGTYGSWNTASGVSGSVMEAGTALCRSLGGVPDATGALQEHNGPELKIKGDLLAATSSTLCDGVAGGASVSCANAQVIVGFSASQFVARSNGKADPAPGPGVGLGSIAGSSFVTGTAPNVAAVPAGYADPIFGRDVYNVFLTPVIADTSNGVLQSLFVGPTSAVCTADNTVVNLGFLALSDAACGTTTLKGSYFTGNS